MMKYGIFLLVLVAAVWAEKVNYTGYRVYRVVPSTDHHIKMLRVLQESGAYDFWAEPTSIGKAVDVMVPPHMINRFNDAVSLLNTQAELIIPNVQEKIDQENPNYKPGARAITWDAYYPLDALNQWLMDLATQYPSICRVVIVGQSYEARSIYGLRCIFDEASSGRIGFIEAGIHAREWIAPATASYILNEFLTTTDAETIKYRNMYEWIVVPNYNPDGYVYTWTDERLWRKTRTPYPPCVGADPNRNWDYQWNTGGSSNFSCSDTYAGPTAFSESSTRTISQYISAIGAQIDLYMAFHSYSQLLLIPYGSSNAHVENYNELKLVGDNAIAVLAQYYGTQYQCGNIVDLLYVASGGSMDWVKGIYHTRTTYTYELRDTGTYGFELPASQILPTSIETFASFMSILKQMNP